MANQQLVDYIRNTLSMGYGEPELRAFLISRGFAFQDVDEAFEAVQGAKPFEQLSKPQAQPQYAPQQQYQPQPMRPAQFGQTARPQPMPPAYQQPRYTPRPQPQPAPVQPSPASPSSDPTNFKHRSPGLVILFTFLTFGIYALYWLVVTSSEMRSATQEAPDPMLLLFMLVPLVNIVVIFLYYAKYCKAVKLLTGFSSVGLFLLFIFLSPVAMAVTQSKLNQIADR